MNRDRSVLSAVPYPITRTSNIPERRDENPAMPRWRDEGSALREWLQEEDVPARRFDASDEWDDKWLRPLLVVPPSQAPPAQVMPSQPAKAESAPEKNVVVVVPAKRVDAGAERDTKRLRPEFSVAPPSQLPPSEPTKAGNVSASMEPEAIPLNLRFLRWLLRLNQGQAKRYSTPDLVAYYFTGGTPRSFQVRNMSATGLYLLTPERWAPGTLIQMTLHKDGRGGSPKESISVLSELVRFDENGAGFSFVLPDYEYLCAYGLRPEELLDRKSIERFMRKIVFRS